MELDQFLAERRISLPRHEHPAVMTVEESERLVPALPGAKTKNLFLRDKKGLRHLLVTVPSNLAVDLNRLGETLGVGRLGFASAERLRRHLVSRRARSACWRCSTTRRRRSSSSSTARCGKPMQCRRTRWSTRRR